MTSRRVAGVRRLRRCRRRRRVGFLLIKQRAILENSAKPGRGERASSLVKDVNVSGGFLLHIGISTQSRSYSVVSIL